MRVLFIAALVIFSTVFAASDSSAQRLPVDVTPGHYDLSFDVDLANARFSGDETIRVDLSQPTRTIALNAAEITFKAVAIETAAGRQMATVAMDEGRQIATLRVPRQMPKGPAQ